jgi:hypothetical protein
VDVLLFHEGLVGVTNQTQILRWVGPQNELEIALMRVMAANAITVNHRLVDMVSCQ